MKAYLIDPFLESISQVEYDGHYRSIYDLIQAPLFTRLRLDDHDVIYLDDEGLYRENQRYFLLQGYNQPLAGRGLVVGIDEEGGDDIPEASLDDLRSRISWVPDNVECFDFEAIEDVVDHPFLGRVPRISHVPLFRIKGGSS